MLSKFLVSREQNLCANGRVGQAQTNFGISASLRFQCYVFFFLNARPAKIPPKNQEAREANFAKYFPPHPQHFAKFSSRSAFLHSASFAPKTLWRSAERSSALLLQQKHHASRGGASARGER